jgi:hypothetical protein
MIRPGAARRWALAAAGVGVSLVTGGVTAGVAGTLAGCQKRREPTELEVPAPPPPPVPQPPVDHTLPGELAEGNEKAFGLPLPRVVNVKGRFTDLVIGVAEVSSDRVANYVRQRVSPGKVETGPTKTVFDRAIVRGHPELELSIEVLAHGGSTEIQVRNLPTGPGTPGLSDEERWRAFGLGPDGKLLDPKHLH